MGVLGMGTVAGHWAFLQGWSLTAGRWEPRFIPSCTNLDVNAPSSGIPGSHHKRQLLISPRMGTGCSGEHPSDSGKSPSQVWCNLGTGSFFWLKGRKWGFEGQLCEQANFLMSVVRRCVSECGIFTEQQWLSSFHLKNLLTLLPQVLKFREWKIESVLLSSQVFEYENAGLSTFLCPSGVIQPLLRRI